MFTTSYFHNLFVSVEHLTVDSNNPNKEGYVADLGLTNVPCNIQPESPEETALFGGAYGKISKLFTTSSGIIPGDRVTVSGTLTKFLVHGVLNYNYGPLQHYEYRLQELLK